MVPMRCKIKGMVNSTRIGWTKIDHDAWHTHTHTNTHLMHSRLDLSSICCYVSSAAFVVHCSIITNNSRTLRNTKTKPNTAGIQQYACGSLFQHFHYDLLIFHSIARERLRVLWIINYTKSKTKVNCQLEMQ